MKRDKHDKGDEADGQKSIDSDKRLKLDRSLNLEDLGAGYEAEDRKIVRAINTYETKLLPYIEQNNSVFKRSNFLALKGYAVGISSSTDNSPITSDR